MSHDYRQTAHEWAGPGREALVDAVAAYHHANESIHMHQDIGSREPCSYCWLRAARAVQILAGQGALVDGPLAGVRAERARQDELWGEQNHPDGTSAAMFEGAANDWRRIVKAAAAKGKLTWRHILLEEAYEALASDDPAELRTELVQVAAVAVAWIEAIDRRTASENRAGES